MSNLLVVPKLLLDGTGSAPQHGLAVLVQGDRITDVVAASTLPAESLARRIDLPGATLLPGLIDTHVHLTLDGGPTPRQTMMRADNDMLLLRAASQAREALLSGVTTVRDCGGRDDVTFILREGILQGATQGPHLLLCGQPLTPPRGHCYFMHGEVETKDDMVRMIERLARRGADFIKVMATGGGLTPGTNSLALQFSPEDLAFLVTEAARFGLPVSAHAHSPDAVTAAVMAGVATIEHGTCATAEGIVVNDAIIQPMVDRGTVVVPTLIPAEKAVQAGRTLGLAREMSLSSEDFLAAREEALRRFHQAGIRLIAGSDAGATGVRFGDVRDEIALLARIGQASEQAIAAATGWAAEALGLKDRGRIAPGYLADLVAVPGDVTADLGALHRPLLIIHRGKLVWEDWGWASSSS